MIMTVVLTGIEIIKSETPRHVFKKQYIILSHANPFEKKEEN